MPFLFTFGIWSFLLSLRFFGLAVVGLLIGVSRLHFLSLLLILLPISLVYLWRGFRRFVLLLFVFAFVFRSRRSFIIFIRNGNDLLIKKLIISLTIKIIGPHTDETLTTTALIYFKWNASVCLSYCVNFHFRHNQLSLYVNLVCFDRISLNDNLVQYSGAVWQGFSAHALRKSGSQTSARMKRFNRQGLYANNVLLWSRISAVSCQSNSTAVCRVVHYIETEVPEL